MQNHFLLLVLLSLIAQQVAGLVPEPRVSDNPRFAVHNAIGKQREKIEFKRDDASDSSLMGLQVNVWNSSAANEPVELTRRARFVLDEPYKSVIQTTARFAIAQTSLPNYIQIDTVMDLISDTSYLLASPPLLSRALHVGAISLATVMTALIFVPPQVWRLFSTSWRTAQGRLLDLDHFLPNGLNELGLVQLLEAKTEELVARFQLNQPACRSQTVCQAGELLRCAFPRVSKSLVALISENFSRPRYRDHEYLGAFLRGFIDQNCAANAEMDQSRACLSTSIKSLASGCSRGASSKPSSQTSNNVEKFQTLQAGRA